MQQLGIRSDLRGKYRKSFCAVITPDGVWDEISDEQIAKTGSFGHVSYSIVSAGYSVGNTCSIIINEKEYAKNHRGLNIVVFDNKTESVTDSLCFDTFKWDVLVTREA